MLLLRVTSPAVHKSRNSPMGKYPVGKLEKEPCSYDNIPGVERLTGQSDRELGDINWSISAALSYSFTIAYAEISCRDR